MNDFAADRRQAEQRFPFLKRFRDVRIAPAQVKNPRGLGEFVEPDNPDNPFPGQWTITVGENSKSLQGGIADTIIADMVHAAADMNPEFQGLKRDLVNSLSPGERDFARRRYEKDFKGKFSGSNFANFENFLNRYWADGIIQHLLLPENSEIAQIMEMNPDARPVLERIEHLFLTDPEIQ